MSDAPDEQGGPVEESSEFDEGRYLYCIVRAEEGDSFAVDGIEDGETSLVVAADAGVGAVVQSVSAPFDSSSPEEIQRWLLRHQGVVDDAGERFGTPLPFRFDTIMRGDDEAVQAWLREERATLETALDRFAGRWEYRVEVAYDPDEAREELVDEDERLAELREEIDAADEGKAFLLEKKYETRLGQLLDERRNERAGDLADRLAPLVAGFEDLGERRSVGLDVGDDDETETLARFALLADEDATDAVGDELDAVAADPGVEVRFTGPWPPYSFAPSFGEVREGASDGTDTTDGTDADDDGAPRDGGSVGSRT